MIRELKTYQAEGHNALREMLTRLQNEAQQRIKDLRRDQEQESDSGPADAMDSASTTEEIETHAGLIARAEEKLRYLDEAFTRLDAGKYGRCLKCGGAIPIERLMAIPFATYCIDCQQQLHRARGGWGEGTTIEPYDHQWTIPEEMEEPTERESRRTDPEEQLTVRENVQAVSIHPGNRNARTGSPRKRSSGPKKGPKP
jgi:DnaK suppressor protein